MWSLNLQNITKIVPFLAKHIFDKYHNISYNKLIKDPQNNSNLTKGTQSLTLILNEPLLEMMIGEIMMVGISELMMMWLCIVLRWVSHKLHWSGWLVLLKVVTYTLNSWPCSGSRKIGERGARNMKYKPPCSVAIFFRTIFYRPGGGHSHLIHPSLGSATLAPNKNNVIQNSNNMLYIDIA